MLETDETLFERVRGGDLRAFDTLYERYEVRLFGFLIGQVKNRADAEELFHEVFLATLRMPPERLEPGAFRAWLYRVARNAASNRLRSSKRGANAIARISEGEPSVAADELLEACELEQALRQAVDRLPPALAEVFHLRSAGLSYEEIAEMLDLPVGTLKSRMHTLVGSLREELKPWTAR